MPIGSFLNAFAPAFFLVVHLAAFLIGAFFASRAFSVGSSRLGWGFTLFAIAEMLDLVAFILVFVGAVQPVLQRGATRAAAHA